MRKNKVVLVPFPFDDLSLTKIRPAVCLTDMIGAHRHIILAFITSHVAARPLATDIVIDSGTSDFESTGLHVSSTLQLHRLVTVTDSLIQRELGVLPPRLQHEVTISLRKLFDLK